RSLRHGARKAARHRLYRAWPVQAEAGFHSRLKKPAHCWGVFDAGILAVFALYAPTAIPQKCRSDRVIGPRWTTSRPGRLFFLSSRKGVRCRLLLSASKHLSRNMPPRKAIPVLLKFRLPFFLSVLPILPSTSRATRMTTIRVAAF